MKQRKLRGYVLPTLYVVVLMIIFGAVSLITTLFKNNPSYLYSIGILKNVAATPVIEIDGSLSEGIIKPFVSEQVSIDKYFYDINAEEENQEKALIYFENTYMKNTGVLYKASEKFDVVMVLDGTVLNVKKDELLGNMVEIEHHTNLRTIYYSLDEVNVKVGDFLSQGEVVGTSGKNSISESDNSLLFEVYYNGKLINPEEFYKMDASSLN